MKLEGGQDEMEWSKPEDPPDCDGSFAATNNGHAAASTAPDNNNVNNYSSEHATNGISDVSMEFVSASWRNSCEYIVMKYPRLTYLSSFQSYNNNTAQGASDNTTTPAYNITDNNNQENAAIGISGASVDHTEEGSVEYVIVNKLAGDNNNDVGGAVQVEGVSEEVRLICCREFECSFFSSSQLKSCVFVIAQLVSLSRELETVLLI